MPKSSDDLPLLTFPDAAAFERWLDAQPATSPGAWLRFAKQGAGKATIGKSDAVDSAIAYGWIDGQIGRIDDHAFKIRFTPRRPRSVWSQINRLRVERLEAAGRMRPQGRAQVDQAKADGRWDRAYPAQSRATPPPDLVAALEDALEAKAMFDALDAANRFAVLFRVQQAKTAEQRAAKIADVVAMLGRGETIHPRRGKRSA